MSGMESHFEIFTNFQMMEDCHKMNPRRVDCSFKKLEKTSFSNQILPFAEVLMCCCNGDDDDLHNRWWCQTCDDEKRIISAWCRNFEQFQPTMRKLVSFDISDTVTWIAQHYCQLSQLILYAL